MGEELVDRHRRAGEREHLPRRRRTEDARRDAIERRRLPAYLDEKCAASDAARTGSTRGSSCALPRVEIAGYQTFGDNAAEGYDTTNLQFTANMTHVRANHTLKFGTDMRRHARTGFLPGASQGLYIVRSDLHAAVLRHGAGDAGQPGLSWAAFMLGIPTTSTLNTPVDYSTSSPYYSAFAQEAWRATSKLTVNLGLRFEVEQGMTETADRMITSFDPDSCPHSRTKWLRRTPGTRFPKYRWRRSAIT